ncbi:PilZ domain-containing protein [Aquitalea sp. S1-19]|nr:PilZ domain-containing protein [Aquitalea sp. S1-19]
MFDLKAFIGSVMGRNGSQHASAATVTQLAQNLPEAEFHSAFIDIIKAISRLNSDMDVPLKERLQALLYVDEASYTFHEKICAELLDNNARSQSYLPSILSYWSELSNGYQLCIRQFQRSKNTPLDDDIKLATLRALHHQLGLVKWSALRYLTADASIWQQAYHIYAFTEAQHFQREMLRIYPKHEAASAEGLLIAAAMLHLAQTDNLLPQEIEGVSHLLIGMVRDVKLQEEPAASEFQYVLNLNQAQAPQLLRRGTIGKGCRYWSGESVLNRLADLMLAFDQQTPENLTRALPALDRQAWQNLLDKLATRWSQDGGKSMRRHERTITFANSLVEVGLERIALAIKLSRSSEERGDNWKVNDISDTGMGLVYLGRNVDGLKLGRLIWVSTESQNSTLGIIRRIQRLSEGGTKVGVEVIAYSPLVVGLSETHTDTSNPLAALYVTQANAKCGERMLLIPQRLAEAGRTLIFSANAKAYQIRIKACLAKLEETAQVDFETLERVNT